MQKSKYILFLVLPLVLGSFNTIKPNTLALNIFLQLSGIEGESQDSNHMNWIDVKSYSFNATNSRSIAIGTSSVGRVNGSDLSIAATMLDKSFTALLDKLFKAEPIANGILEVRRSGVTNGSSDYDEKNTLTDILVTSVNVTGTNATAGTVDVSFTLNFRRIERSIKDLQSNGQYGNDVVMKWDYSTNSTF